MTKLRPSALVSFITNANLTDLFCGIVVEPLSSAAASSRRPRHYKYWVWHDQLFESKLSSLAMFMGLVGRFNSRLPRWLFVYWGLIRGTHHGYHQPPEQQHKQQHWNGEICGSAIVSKILLQRMFIMNPAWTMTSPHRHVHPNKIYATYIHE